MAHAPRVFTIPSSQPFLETLAQAILTGRVVPGWPDADPLSLADGTIFLPNRRACRAMQDAFRTLAGPRTLVLPTILPIGDVDEDEWAFLEPSDSETTGFAALPQAPDALGRRLMLARLVKTWAASVEAMVVERPDDEPLVVSASTADALSLAADLMRLMDQAETERVPWTRLDRIVETGLDRYWSITRQFLAIVSEHWPAMLMEQGLIEPARRRDLAIAAETSRLEARQFPVIVAGSTGSIPATRDMMRMVASHAKGCVVLPGLDRDLDEAAWTAIGPDQAGHPQFGLKRLLSHIGIDRAGVDELVKPAGHGREAILSEAMRPPEATGVWVNLAPPVEETLDGLTLIQARHEREEALAVALALREALEEPLVNAALVTPDRALAQRVIAELQRWGVDVDDSGGGSLAATPAGIVARLCTDLALGPPDPATLLALIAHPAARTIADHPDQNEGLAAIELVGLRGQPAPTSLAEISRRLLSPLLPLLRPGDPRLRIEDRHREAGRQLLKAVEDAIEPVAALAARADMNLADLAQALATSLHALGVLSDTPDGGATHDLLRRMAMGGESTGLALRADEAGRALGTLLSGETLRRPGTPGARVRVLGLPEARLLRADLVVLAGLTEGVWPPAVRLDPFMNRAMRAAFGIEAPERRIGLAAHDFCQLVNAPRVVMSTAAKTGGVPSVASRWLQRLQVVLGPSYARLVTRGNTYLAIAEQLDRPAIVTPAPRPIPCPPVSSRPSRLSITEIETLLRDPYAIYARHVLRLQPLPELTRDVGAGERGTLIHDALARYARWRDDHRDHPDPADQLVAIGRELFAPFADDPAVRAIWLPRFVTLAAWFVAEDDRRRLNTRAVLTEVSLRLPITRPSGTDFLLTGRADRIDLLDDGTVEVIDYKTGRRPTDSEVRSGLSPQLTLEAAMIRAGALPTLPSGAPVSGLLYATLSGRHPPGAFEQVNLDNRPVDLLAAEHLSQLSALLADFERVSQGYPSWAIPQKEGEFGDYGHLARLGEWELGR